MPTAQPNPNDYLYTGAFSQGVFQKNYEVEFKKVPKYNLASMPDLLFVLGKIAADSRIIDIRWSAYMLATVFIESSHTVKVTKQTTDKKGKVKTHTVKEWRNFRPIEETGHGKGKRYYLPVKVKKLPNGDAKVTEYDGDQWAIASVTGLPKPKSENPKLGARATTVASSVYEEDDGGEQLYYGRGYVQLTWWTNYAIAGVVLGRGLAFLFDPNLVNDRNAAYDILATGMCTGKIFANGKKFSQFFIGGLTDYVGARAMVNAGDPNKEEVAAIAERFEKVLFTSKLEVAAK